MVSGFSLASKLLSKRRQWLAVAAFLAVSLGFPLQGAGATLSLSKDGPETAREGDLIEYSLEVVNEGTVSVAGIEVLDTLPVEVQFVQAAPTPGGTYNSISGIWTLPTLGTSTDDKTAGIKIQALVNQNLIYSPADAVSTTNRAEVTAPPDQTPLEAIVTTNVICSSCIDWEIESVTFEQEYASIDIDDYYGPRDIELRFYLRVKVANNGPVTSNATVSVVRFDIDGGGFGSIKLSPSLPVAVTLDPGQTETIQFSTARVKGDDLDFTVSWKFEVSDVALSDPVLPNTSSGSYSSSGGESDDIEGCFIVASAHGSYLAPHVVTLRNFRDRHLFTNPFGKWFVAFYYRHSPAIADYIRERPTLRVIVRSVLALVVCSIEYPIAAVLVLLMLPLLLACQRKQRKTETYDYEAIGSEPPVGRESP